jgi:hypothetical protein
MQFCKYLAQVPLNGAATDMQDLADLNIRFTLRDVLQNFQFAARGLLGMRTAIVGYQINNFLRNARVEHGPIVHHIFHGSYNVLRRRIF